jgi:hypothetical protein
VNRQRSPKPVAADYDRDPARFRLARSVLRRHALAPDIHGQVATPLPVTKRGALLYARKH